MPAGFQAFNTATGSVQVDENYANLALLTKVTITSAANGNWAATATLSVASPTMPVVAVQSAVFVQLFRVYQSGGNWTFVYHAASAGAAINCYVFGKPVAPSGSGAGLQVFDASGSLTFDSRLKYARVAQMISGASYASTPAVTLPSGRTYAAVQCRYAGEYELAVQEDDGGPSGSLNQREDFRGGLGLRIAGNVATPGYFQVFYRLMPTTLNVNDGYFVQWQPYQWLILDVTGY